MIKKIKPFKVLVIDDERLIADSIRNSLTKGGYQSRSAYSAGKALEVARVLRPHLVVSDVMVRGSSEANAATEICKLLPACKVLLFSGHAANAGLLVESRKLQQNFEFLNKPVHPQDLIDRSVATDRLINKSA